MVRTPIMVVVALATMAASPLRGGLTTWAISPDRSALGGSSVASPPDAAQPAEAQAPETPGSYAPAPVPDDDSAAPTQAYQPAQPQVEANLITPGRSYQGEGYLPGSTVQGSQDRGKGPAPGVNLKVPLD